MTTEERLAVVELLLLLTTRLLPESIIRDMVLEYFKDKLAKRD